MKLRLCALERVRRMEHLAGTAAAAAIDQPRLRNQNPARRVALRSMAMWHDDKAIAYRAGARMR